MSVPLRCPLVARGERVALGVVARDGGGQRLAVVGATGVIVTRVDDRRRVGGRDRPGERVASLALAVADGDVTLWVPWPAAVERAADDAGGGAIVTPAGRPVAL